VKERAEERLKEIVYILQSRQKHHIRKEDINLKLEALLLFE